MHRRLAAWLGLFAMFMAFAGPLYAQLRAYDSVALASIDLEALHCGEHEPGDASPRIPDWVAHLDKCGYCSLLAHNPPAAAPPALLAPAPALSLVSLPSPEQGAVRQPRYLPRARGPPVHA